MVTCQEAGSSIPFSFTKETKRRVESQTRYDKRKKRDIIDDSLVVEEVENIQAIHEDINRNDTKFVSTGTQTDESSFFIYK